MEITIDTSALLAVIVNESSKARIVELTQECDLVCPTSVYWEMGNAFSAMIKRGRISEQLALDGIEAFQQIPIRFLDVDLQAALQLSAQFSIYAYDAYLLQCALQTRTKLLSLDQGLIRVAKQCGLTLLEV
ncbi:MAG: type II toxin-antitoxin system VapC family toxin [Thiolinea sp.]|mgnify:CR=1 FL=1